MKKSSLMFGLLLAAQTFAISVDFYDEQQNNPSTTGVRLRINNDSDSAINDAKLRYYFRNTSGKAYEVNGYYLAGAKLSWKNVNDSLAYFELSIPTVSTGYYPDLSGYSLALHYTDWSNWNKNLDFSYQTGSSLLEDTNVVLLSGDDVIYGNVPDDATAPAKDMFRISGVKAADGAWLEIENIGCAAASTKNLSVIDAFNKASSIGDVTLEVGEKIRLSEDKESCGEIDKCVVLEGFAWDKNGEAMLKSGNTILSYVAWGKEGSLASTAVEAGVWSDARAYLPSAYEVKYPTAEFTQNTFFRMKPMANAASVENWYSFTSNDDAGKSATVPSPVKLSANKPVYKRIAGDESVLLSWVPVDGVSEYTVTVRNAANEIVVQEQVYGSSIETNLSTGSYSWDVRPGFEAGYATVDDKGTRHYNYEFFGIEDQNIDMSVGRWINIESIAARRDTRLLDLGWLEEAENQAWDRPNPEATSPATREINRCWAIAIEAMNHYYGGDLTQDEIVYHAYFSTEEPLLSALPPWTAGFGLDESGNITLDGHLPTTLKWALRTDQLNFHEGYPPYAVVKDAIDNGKPIYVTTYNPANQAKHAMVIYGYAGAVGNFAYFYMNLYNNNGGYASSLLYDYTNIVSYMIPEVEYGNVEMSNPLVTRDSDGDGVMDSDEDRFGTNKYSRDSDNDGIEDKREIYNYTIASNIKEDTPVEDPGVYDNCSDKTICQQYYVIHKKSDVDGDNVRKETDPDDDNDGIRDGLEDESQTTTATVSDLHDGYTLFGRDFVTVNDHANCYNTSFVSESYCNIGSEDNDKFRYVAYGTTRYSVSIGAKANVGNIDTYTSYEVVNKKPGSYIRLRSDAKVHGNVTLAIGAITYVRQDTHGFSVDDFVATQQGATIEGEKTLVNANLSPYAGIYTVNYNLPDFESHVSSVKKVIKSGETYHLKDGDEFGEIIVNAGGTLVVEPGEMYINNRLQIDASATINFAEPGKGTVLHLNGKLTWNKYKTENDSDEYWINVAKGFKLIQHSSESMYFNGMWAGTIYAPISPVVMGQSTKTIYGRVLARSIVIHQYSRVFRVDFNPTDATEIAYLIK